MRFRVLDPIKDRKEWQKFAPNDLYYSSDFMVLSQINFGNLPQAFVYSDDKNYVFFPFIRRLVNCLPFFESKELWWDIISPEYSGCYVKGNPDIILAFMDAFHKWCLENNVVAEYVRCSPVLENARWHPEAKIAKETIYIDLRPPEEKIFMSFQKKCRQNCRYAVKKGVTIRETRDEKDILAFHNLYIRSMDRHQARQYFYLKPDFFKNTLWFLKKNSKLYVAEHNGKIIAGSIVLFKGETAYDYYRASDISAQAMRPSNLIVYHIAQQMKAQGCLAFVLGSGYAKGDGIENFKRGFSDKTWPFYVSKIIHNQEMYDKLCELRKKHGGPVDENFFPAYRG